MEFGRLPSVDQVDFTLPPDSPENATVLAGPRDGRGILLGTAGWSDRGFVGELYPAGTKSADFLREYARVFPTNELNSTFYGASRERVERWAAAVPDDFRFCPKLPSEITHVRELRDVEEPMETFLGVCGGLGPKVGLTWFILPPGFGPARLSELTDFLERWAPRARFAVELRHPAWFSSAAARDEVFAAFAEHGVTTILTDVAGRRDVLHMRLTTPDVMIRFVGNEPHPSDFTRLDDWIARLNGWLDRGLDTAYFFLHQKRDHRTIPMARHFLEHAADRVSVELDATPAPAPVQGELF